MSRISGITANTLVPITFVGVVAMGAFWIAKVQANTEENTRNITSVTDQHGAVCEKLDVISQRLSRIEGYVLKLSEKGVKHE